MFKRKRLIEVAHSGNFVSYIDKSNNAIIFDCPYFPSSRSKSIEYIETIEKDFSNIVKLTKNCLNSRTVYCGSIFYYRTGEKVHDNDNTILSHLINVMKHNRLISDDMAFSFTIINVADKNKIKKSRIIILDKQKKPFEKKVCKLLS